MKKIKVGLIGAGRIGRFHAETIKANVDFVEIKSVADIFAENIKDWAENLGIKNVYKDANEILKSPLTLT